MTLLGVPAARADLRYRIVRLDPHHCVECPSPASRAYDINDLFNVVGWAEIRPAGENDEVRRAFIWSPDGIGSVVPAEDVHPVPHWSDGSGYDPDFASEARGINVHDQVAGWGELNLGGSLGTGELGFLWLPTIAFGYTANAMHTLDSTYDVAGAQSRAYDLDDEQEPLRIVGVSFDGSGEPDCGINVPTRWEPASGMSNDAALALPMAWPNGAAYGIAPLRFDPMWPPYHAGEGVKCLSFEGGCARSFAESAPIAWKPGSTDLEAAYADGRKGVAYAATTDGHVVGATARETPPSGWSSCVKHATIWAPGATLGELLPMPVGAWQQDESEAYAIAGDGAGGYRVVGAHFASFPNTSVTALLWEGSPGSWTVSVLEDLTSIVTATTCGFDDLEAAWGVNESGWIVGWGTSSTTDQDQAFVLIPIEDCPADFDRDGQVGFTDMTSVLANWNAVCLPHEVCTLPDPNADCVVDNDDLIIVLANWGDCESESLLASAPGLAEMWLMIGGTEALLTESIDQEAFEACFESSESALGVFGALCELLDSSEEE